MKNKQPLELTIILTQIWINNRNSRNEFKIVGLRGMNSLVNYIFKRQKSWDFGLKLASVNCNIF